MSKPLVEFSPEHLDLLKRYLNFFKIKKEGAFKEVHLAIKDIKKDRDN